MPDYGQPLREQDVDADPLRQIELWREQARAAGVREPEAAALATASADGAPSVRMLLVKSFDHRGFVVLHQLRQPEGARADRQSTCVAAVPLGSAGSPGADQRPGRAHQRERDGRLRPQQAAQQPAQRARLATEPPPREPRGARAGPRRARAALRLEELPLPESWGGFRLRPVTIELWQQRHDRLHDRLRYRRSVEREDAWELERLAP